MAVDRREIIRHAARLVDYEMTSKNWDLFTKREAAIEGIRLALEEGRDDTLRLLGQEGGGSQDDG